MKRLLISAILIALTAGVYFLLPSFQNQKVSGVSPEEDTLVMNEPEVVPEMYYGWIKDSVEAREYRIRYGENLATIFSSINVPGDYLQSIAYVPREVFDPRYIKARNPYTVIFEKNSEKPKSLIYHENKVDFVQFNLEDSLIVFRGKHPVDTIRKQVAGIISSSLYESLMDQGSSPMLANEMADIYAWVIDFFGLQKGDSYKLIYDEYQVNGEFAGLGPIYAADFTHMDKDYYAFRYDQGEGHEYFDEEGKSLRKTMLKAPLRYNRVSSGFSYSRLHPILKIRRPHLGVDYAAPAGTPVVSVGDGEVISAYYDKGGGNMIKIRHNANYTTAYLHLSGFAKGIRKGAKVAQGQVIGYVGSTGLSTGPHLDFRFWKNGKPVDPLKVEPPSANPIREDQMAAFTISMKPWLVMLEEVNVSEPVPLVASDEEINAPATGGV